MDDQKDEGAGKSPIIKPTKEAARTTATTNEATTIVTSKVPFIERKWVKRTAIGVLVAAVIAVIANATSIPNNVMSWFINWKQLNENGAQPTSQPLIIVQTTQPPAPIGPMKFRQKNMGEEIILGSMTMGFPPVPSGQTGIADIGRKFLMMQPGIVQFVASEEYATLNIKFEPVCGMPALEITNNELSGLPQDWECNHSDRGIEIVNEGRVPMFQMYYKDDTHIVIKGIITGVNKQGLPVVVFVSDGLQINTTQNETMTNLVQRIKSAKIERIFKYPAWQHPGQFVEQ